MVGFNELRKAAKKLPIPSGAPYRVAILGDSATQYFATAIEGYAKLSKLPLQVLDTDYNAIDTELIDEHSATRLWKPDAILLWLSTPKLYQAYEETAADARAEFATQTMNRIETLWMLIEKCGVKTIIQPNFPESFDAMWGNYSSKVNASFVYQMRSLQYLLSKAMSTRNNVYPIDLQSIAMRFGEKDFFDAALYYNAKMAIALNALPTVAKAVVDVIAALKGTVKKCIVLDLDNTLWGGVIGDDGLAGIELGEFGRGMAFSAFQRWLLQMKERGIILTVCSKNNENTAKEPFEKHEDMVLRLDDISLFVANWEDKASNIKMIRETLSIGMDSMVFLDDNPFERNLVRQMIPEICVPELPEDPALYVSFLVNENLFETATYAKENTNRTKQYQAEMERIRTMTTFTSIDEYLESLEMKGTAKPFEPIRFARIAELSQRSNQFNLRTIRYSEADIEAMANDSQYITLYFMLKDRFGDHGLVSVVILKKMSEAPDTVFVDTWFMSCRVLKRGMEEFIMNSVVNAAKEKGYGKIIGEYIPTPKNEMVRAIYSKMGFQTINDNQYMLETKTFVPFHHFISEVES